MSTFLELANDVRAQSGISGEGPTSVRNQIGIQADIVRWVKEAYADIQTKKENWNFLHSAYQFTLQGGQNLYNPAQLVGSNGAIGVRTATLDTFRIYDAVKQEWSILKYVPWSVWQIDREILKDTERGIPRKYTVDPSNNYQFFPYEISNVNPVDNIDHLVKFYGFSRPDVMTDNGDKPIFHEQYHELIKLQALMRYGEYYNAQEVYQSARFMFEVQFEAMLYSEMPRDYLVTPPFVPFA